MIMGRQRGAREATLEKKCEEREGGVNFLVLLTLLKCRTRNLVNSCALRSHRMS
jgi:hypothetical protein